MKSRFFTTLLVLTCFSFWGVRTLAAPFNKYATFSGTNSYVPVLHFPLNSINLPSGYLTVEAWIKTTQTGTGTIIGWKTDGAEGLMLRISGGKLQYGEWVGNSWTAASSVASVNTGNWTHVAAVRSGTNVKLYVNGVEESPASTMHANPYCASNQLNIGTITTVTPNTEAFVGSIDEVRVWSTARTVTEIMNTKDNTLIGSETGLLACYQFENANGASISKLPNLYNVTYNAGQLNNSIVCSGSASSFLSVAPIYQLPANSYTMEAWVNCVAGETNQTIVSFKNTTPDVGIVFRAADCKLQLGEWDGENWSAVTSTSSINTGVWTHVACVRENTNATLFINGVQDGQATDFIVRAASLNTNQINFGNSKSGATEFFSGAIDEVRVWSSLRTAQQIIDNKDVALTGTEVDVLGVYPLDTDGRNLAYAYTPPTVSSPVNVTFTTDVPTKLQTVDDSDIVVFANQSDNNINVKIPVAGEYKLVISNICGKEMLTKSVHLSESGLIQLNMNSQTKGVFLLNVIKSNGKSYTFKLLK